jgi:hypothetical protein
MMSEAEIAGYETTAGTLLSEPGTYRKDYRAERSRGAETGQD